MQDPLLEKIDNLLIRFRSSYRPFTTSNQQVLMELSNIRDEYLKQRLKEPILNQTSEQSQLSKEK